MIDMTGGREDHGSMSESALSCARNVASSSRQRRSSRTRPPSMRPMTGTGSARKAPRQRFDGSAGAMREGPQGQRGTGQQSIPAARRCRSGFSSRLERSLRCSSERMRRQREGAVPRGLLSRPSNAPAAAGSAGVRRADQGRRKGAARPRARPGGSCRAAALASAGCARAFGPARRGRRRAPLAGRPATCRR